jgi:hypothetical protein
LAHAIRNRSMTLPQSCHIMFLNTVSSGLGGEFFSLAFQEGVNPLGPRLHRLGIGRRVVTGDD